MMHFEDFNTFLVSHETIKSLTVFHCKIQMLYIQYSICPTKIVSFCKTNFYFKHTPYACNFAIYWLPVAILAMKRKSIKHLLPSLSPMNISSPQPTISIILAPISPLNHRKWMYNNPPHGRSETRHCTPTTLYCFINDRRWRYDWLPKTLSGMWWLLSGGHRSGPCNHRLHHMTSAHSSPLDMIRTSDRTDPAPSWNNKVNKSQLSAWI